MRTTEEGTGASGYELLDHTADVGIRSWRPSPEAAFEQAAWALVDLLDIRGEGTREARTIGASSGDAPGLLVDFLNELIFLIETEEMAVSGMRVVRLTGGARSGDRDGPVGSTARGDGGQGGHVPPRPGGPVVGRADRDPGVPGRMTKPGSTEVDFVEGR